MIVEPRLFENDVLLKVLSVEPQRVVVEGPDGAHHRATYIPSRDSVQGAPLRPGDILTVTTSVPTQTTVERVTSGQRDGCLYLLREFQQID
jgi:hypothetical protein